MKMSRISGVGRYVPERIVTNRELAQILDVEEEWIEKLTGVKQRHWITEGVKLSDMARSAALQAIDQAGLRPQDIGLVIFSTLSSDHMFPGGGCQLQEQLDMGTAPAIDIRNVCSGFIYGLSIADQYIKTGMYQHVLLVAAELQSTSLDLTNRGKNISILFADGAGAAVISATDREEPGILNTQIYAEGAHFKKLWADAPSPNDPRRLTKELIDSERIYPYMDGRTVFKHAVTRFPEAILESLEKAGKTVDDLKLIIPHQANLRITEMTVRKLKIEKEKAYSNIEYYGNTTSASIPIALSEAHEKGLIRENDLVCLVAFGAGFAWGSALIRWQD